MTWTDVAVAIVVALVVEACFGPLLVSCSSI